MENLNCPLLKEYKIDIYEKIISSNDFIKENFNE
jgi:hypothetical protein